MGTQFEINHDTGVVDFKKKGTTNLVVEKGSSFPGTPTDGHLFYRTDLTQFFVYDNTLTDWKTQAGGSLRIYNEVPAGLVNGSNTVFTTANQYVAGTTIVTRNGLVMKPGDDYTETTPSTGTITFAIAPTMGSTILVSYSRTIGQDVPKLLKFTVETGTPSGTYTGSTTVFDLPFSYTPGTGSLLVFSGGVIMAIGASADYLETDNNTVTFNTARTGGEIVQFLKLGVANDLGNTGGWVEGTGDVTLETVTNQVRIGTGTAALPALSFSTDTDSGIYQRTANTVNFATNGVRRVEIDQDGHLVPADPGMYTLGKVGNEWLRLFMSDGSVSTPAITFGSDTDKGFYNRDANSIAFSNISRESVIFTGGGQGGLNSVGSFNINTGTPSVSNTARLTAQTGTGDGDAYVSLTGNGNSFHMGIDVSDSNAMSFGTSGSVGNNQVMRVPTAGSTVQFADGTAALPGLAFINDTDTGMYRSASNILGFSTGGVSRVTISNQNASTTEFNTTGDGGGEVWQRIYRDGNVSGVLSIEDDHTATRTTLRTGIQFRNYSTSGVASVLMYKYAGGYTGDIVSGLPFSNSFVISPGGQDIARWAWNFGSTGLNAGLYFTNDTGIASQIHVSGTYYAPNGSAASPSLSFFNDGDTGFYRTASNSVGITQNSVLQWEFNGNGSIRAQSSTTNLIQAGFGSAATPGLSFAGDEDSGFYRNASNEVTTSIGGIDTFRVLPANNANDVRIMVFDHTGASLKQVSRGAADSGGAGFRVLRIPN